MYLEFFLLLPECEAGREWLVRLNGLDHPSFLEPHPYLAFQTDSAIPKMIQICIVIHNYLFLSKSDFRHNYNTYWGFPGGASGKESACQCKRCKKTRIRSLCWEDPLEEENGNPLQCSCLDSSTDKRSLAGYSPQGHKELDTAERYINLHTNISALCIQIPAHTCQK